MQWLFLILASCFEILWFYCIAYLNNLKFSDLYTLSFLRSDNWILVLLAIAGYAAFGVANMVFFSKAVQKISPAIAFAVWTGVALLGITTIDAVLQDIQINLWQWISIVSVLIGVIGIKMVTDKP